MGGATLFLGPAAGPYDTTSRAVCPPRFPRRWPKLPLGEALFACALGSVLLIKLGPLDLTIAVLTALVMLGIFVLGWEQVSKRKAIARCDPNLRLGAVAIARSAKGHAVYGYLVMYEGCFKWEPRVSPSSIERKVVKYDDVDEVWVGRRRLCSSYLWTREASGEWLAIMAKAHSRSVQSVLVETGGLVPVRFGPSVGNT